MNDVNVPHGVFKEDNKFVSYVNGVKVYSARMKEHAEKHFNRALKTNPELTLVQKKQVKENPVEPVAVETRSTSAHIPTADPGFVPFGEFKIIDKVIKSGQFFPVFITGPSGNGKSTMVEQSCARNKRSYIRFQVSKDTDEEQLIGSKTLVNGNIQIVEGPVLIAMRTGSILLLDEISIAQPDSLMALQTILEGKPYYFKLKDEIVKPAPGFNIIATDNTKGRGSDTGRYIGTKILNEAFLERFAITLEQEYPSQAVELKIITKAMEKFNCMDEEFAKTLVKWADAIRRTYDDGAIDDLITTRRLLQIVQTYSIFGDKKKSVELACNRFDTLTKASFIEVFEKIDPTDAVVEQNETPVENKAQTPAD